MREQIRAVWVYLIPANGDCQAPDCWRDAQSRVVLLDDEGAQGFMALCEPCLLVSMFGEQDGQAETP